MRREMLKSKIHRATITVADLSYEGSLSIDRLLMDAVDIAPFERVHVYNLNNGTRFDTYAIEAPAGSGVIGLNGAAARMGLAGDLVIVACYCAVDDAMIRSGVFFPKIVLVDDKNRITRKLHV